MRIRQRKTGRRCAGPAWRERSKIGSELKEPRMNRRTFTHALATVALGAAAPSLSSAALSSAEIPRNEGTPFPLSVMLWTVFKDLPFEPRLAKVAEAGYSNVELVGEYAKWSEADFAKANAARKQLGIHFDATAGLPHGIGDPAARDTF